MEDNKVELMVEEVIRFLKKKKMWETDIGIIYNGKHVSHTGVTENNEKLKGAARMWFEGPLNHALNHGINDPEYKIYKGIQSIMEKYGFYPVFDTNCDFNIYPIQTNEEVQ